MHERLSRYVDESVAAGLVDSPAHIDLAYRAAVGGIVLLKNDHGVLPLKRDKSLTVAVIGPNAGCTSDTTLRWNEKTTRDDGAAGGAGGGGLCDAQINYLGNYESTVPPASGVWTVHSALVAAGYVRSSRVLFVCVVVHGLHHRQHCICSFHSSSK